MNNFLGFHEKIGSKDHPLARFNPVQRCTTSATIECFERCHLETLLITVVIREFGHWQALIPTILVVHHTCTEHVLKHLVHLLCLTIGLQVISQLWISWVPREACNYSQKWATNWAPRLEMMVLGTHADTECAQCTTLHISLSWSGYEQEWSEQTSWIDQQLPRWIHNCRQSEADPWWNPYWYLLISRQEYSMVAPIQQVSDDLPWPFDKYCILPHSKQSHTSFLSTRIVLSCHDTFWCCQGE
jgi:hypothetical protein